MKKNFRKIPDSILQTIENIRGNNIIVATVVRLTQNDFNNPRFSDINFYIDNGELRFNDEYIPSQIKGTYSRKNVLGYKIKYPDRPKVAKTYYLGERPIFGDYHKGTFSLYVTRMVIAYDEIPPKELSIKAELIQVEQENGQTFYTIKLSTSEILSKLANNFYNNVLFNLNLLQENIGSTNVFGSDAEVNDFVRSLQVQWELFPPGERDEDIERIIDGVRNLTQQRITQIQERYNFLRDQDPIQIITGSSGMRRYFGAKFSERLVVFENTSYGNALYILFENWRDLSRLSRTEIQTRSTDQYIRVKHSGDWQDKIRTIIQARR